ncbi:MAG: crossover junction endodeoxyribonuclease RuvC [Bacteroidetes bacterium]|nr:crossover junction endodeoxyribonuclease RuvC [Bacteroidota bacterium]MBU1678712.1 crossover junction endodeoxyribonuclease RuvC [Bacteroidota bacterium]MBU2507510.1 crossover junction endodeoxyribonuclease RuvC [Bacteroidota bacterium]
MIIFGVDPGTIITGFGVIRYEKNEITYMDSGIIKPNPHFAIASKLQFIYTELDRLIKKHKPDEFSLETAFYGKNIQSALKIGYARGVSMLAAANNQIPLGEYSPREVKKAVVGKGGASKEQVFYMIQKLMNIKDEKIKHDESDALAVAVCHSFKMKSFSGKNGNWKDFVKANPDKIINN